MANTNEALWKSQYRLRWFKQAWSGHIRFITYNLPQRKKPANASFFNPYSDAAWLG